MRVNARNAFQTLVRVTHVNMYEIAYAWSSPINFHFHLLMKKNSTFLSLDWVKRMEENKKRMTKLKKVFFLHLFFRFMNHKLIFSNHAKPWIYANATAQTQKIRRWNIVLTLFTLLIITKVIIKWNKYLKWDFLSQCHNFRFFLFHLVFHLCEYMALPVYDETSYFPSFQFRMHIVPIVCTLRMRFLCCVCSVHMKTSDCEKNSILNAKQNNELTMKPVAVSLIDVLVTPISILLLRIFPFDKYETFNCIDFFLLFSIISSSVYFHFVSFICARESP